MSDVEHTGYVRGRDDDRVGRAGRILIRPEITLFFPIKIPFLFDPVRVIRFIQDL
jgi:hypothetical protein